MKDSIKKGLGFGLTSSIITTLGLIISLSFGTRSEAAVIGGILTIAIADALADSLGIHISEEVNPENSNKQIWAATFSTLFNKSFFALTFLIPVLLFDYPTTIIVSIIWAFLLLIIFNYYIAIDKKAAPLKLIGEHLFIATLVVIASHYLGRLIS